MPCGECGGRIDTLRSGVLSTEPDSARRGQENFWNVLAEKTRRRALGPLATEGNRSKASVYMLVSGDDEILYVGKSRDVRHRIWNKGNGHAATKPWFHEVSGVIVYDYQTEGQAYDAEARMIFDASPKYNKAIPVVPTISPRPIDHWVYESPEEVRS